MSLLHWATGPPSQVLLTESHIKFFSLQDHHFGYRGLGRNTSFVDGTAVGLTSRLNPETVSDGKATSRVWLLLYPAVLLSSSSSGCNIDTSSSGGCSLDAT